MKYNQGFGMNRRLWMSHLEVVSLFVQAEGAAVEKASFFQLEG